MIVTMSQQAPPISLATSLKSGPKRPRLSLQTSPLQAVPAKSITALRADVDTTSPTAFNTLSNAYAAAIEQASPKVTSASVPWSARTNTDSARPTSLRLVTDAAAQGAPLYPSQRTQTPGPFSIYYPDTPSTSCNSSSPAITHPLVQAIGGSTAEYTPPQSAHPNDEELANKFSFQPNHPSSPRTPRRRATTGSQHVKAPYTHPRSLRSILRNSPLPPRSTISPVSPSRTAHGFSEKGGKKVGYNDPLTQTITTNKYTKSHIDLLAEEATSASSASSPSSPLAPASASASACSGNGLDLAMAYTGVETRDGGQTPGPFEEMRRRMAGLGDEESTSDSNGNGSAGDAENEPGTPINRKRKREKKRRWVWTIGVNEDECDDSTEATSGATGVPHESIGVVDTTSVSTLAPTVAAAEPLPQLEMLAPTVYVPPPPSSKHVDPLPVPAVTVTITPTPAPEALHETEMTLMIRSPMARPGSAHSI